MFSWLKLEIRNPGSVTSSSRNACSALNQELSGLLSRLAEPPEQLLRTLKAELGMGVLGT